VLRPHRLLRPAGPSGRRPRLLVPPVRRGLDADGAARELPCRRRQLLLHPLPLPQQKLDPLDQRLSLPLERLHLLDRRPPVVLRIGDRRVDLRDATLRRLDLGQHVVPTPLQLAEPVRVHLPAGTGLAPLAPTLGAPQAALAHGRFRRECLVSKQAQRDGRQPIPWRSDPAAAALPAPPYQPSTYAKIRGATIVASDSIMNFGVSTSSLPQVIFSLGTAPE